ncbi:Gag-Pol polyprotein [Anthophora plagiata]
MQSRPEFIEMSVGQLLDRFKEMFHHRPSMVTIRQQFQERTWKRGEPFDEYFYDKIIKANRMPVEDQAELVGYLVEGIPDPVLRNQARVQCFTTPEAMLQAFEKLSLPSGNQGGGVRVNHPKPTAAVAASTTGVRRVDEWTPRRGPDRCYNCGAAGHLGRNCPTRQHGAKCYHCGEHGHIAPECKKRDWRQATRSTNYVEQPAAEKTCKMVRLNDHDIQALVDTGSDLTLITAACYVKIGAPRLLTSELAFRGVGGTVNKTLGKFTAKLAVDGHSYEATVHVVSDTVLRHDFLIGTDFLRSVKITINRGMVTIVPTRRESGLDNGVPDIFLIPSGAAVLQTAVRVSRSRGARAGVNVEYLWKKKKKK